MANVTNSPAGNNLPRKEGVKGIALTLLVLLIAPVLALCITAYFFQSYEVDGQSMEHTLQNKDRLIIWKMPKTISRINGRDYIPRRGDVVVFVKKGLYDFNANKDKQLIKRVIGLPGDHIVIRDGVVSVTNKDNPDGFNPDRTLPYGITIDNTAGSADITVPSGEIYVLGDNRGNSQDSRTFGTVSSKDIVGKLIARILPIGKAERF